MPTRVKVVKPSICTFCQGRLSNDGHFCPRCGERVPDWRLTYEIAWSEWRHERRSWYLMAKAYGSVRRTYPDNYKDGWGVNEPVAG